jgi:hypothetical protein
MIDSDAAITPQLSKTPGYRIAVAVERRGDLMFVDPVQVLDRPIQLIEDLVRRLSIALCLVP